MAYYESCQIGLGARYLLAFDVAMGAVCEAPDRYRVEFPPGIRKYRIPGFPYNILYRIVDSDIEVLVVAAHRRRPGVRPSSFPLKKYLHKFDVCWIDACPISRGRNGR